MGIYLNPGDELFWQAVHSEIYVDKTGLLNYTNKVLRTSKKYLCVSRPRRFGKSMAANMIAAYYDRTVDASSTFARLAIAQSDDFETYRNKYDVIQLNMQDFLSRSSSLEGLLSLLKKCLLRDLLKAYPSDEYLDATDLVETMAEIHAASKRPFVIVIDEWDCIFREYREKNDWQEAYLDFLRGWLKDKAYVALVYMTGILPIKKYGTHSALNMFREFSMEAPLELAPYVGFTVRRSGPSARNIAAASRNASGGMMAIPSRKQARSTIPIPWWKPSHPANSTPTGTRQRPMKRSRFISP